MLQCWLNFAMITVIYVLLAATTDSTTDPLRPISDHLPWSPTYLVAETSDHLALAASFNHRYIVPTPAAELLRLLALSSGTPYALRYLPTTTENLPIHSTQTASF